MFHVQTWYQKQNYLIQISYGSFYIKTTHMFQYSRKLFWLHSEQRSTEIIFFRKQPQHKKLL